jgi:hypothetical protein
VLEADARGRVELPAPVWRDPRVARDDYQRPRRLAALRSTPGTQSAGCRPRSAAVVSSSWCTGYIPASSDAGHHALCAASQVGVRFEVTVRTLVKRPTATVAPTTVTRAAQARLPPFAHSRGSSLHPFRGLPRAQSVLVLLAGPGTHPAPAGRIGGGGAREWMQPRSPLPERCGSGLI